MEFDLADEDDSTGTGTGTGDDTDTDPPEEMNIVKYEVEDEEEHEDSLFNDVILSRLMQYVKTEDLPNCRLVCKVWAEEAWRQLTKRKCISFRESSMQQFVEFMKIVQVNNIHFSKLHFCHFNVQDYRKELTEYFTSAGCFVKELTLSFMDKEITLEQLENVFLSSVPRLEFLALDRLPCDFFAADAKLSGLTVLKKLTRLRLNTRCHYNSDEERSTVFFMDLLRLSPNLQCLNGAVEWCLPRLVTAISISKLPNLSNLVLKGCVDCPTAQKLASAEFNLKTLYLGTSTFFELGRKHNIIYSKRHTLRALGLGWASFMKRIDLRTISDDYKELACLSLCDASKWSLSGSPYTGPGLKRLLADIRNENDFIYLEQRREAFVYIRELSLRFLSYQVEDFEIVDRIELLFPNLKLLTLNITQKFPVSRIWTALTNLEELSLNIKGNSTKICPNQNKVSYLDEVLTGLGEDECRELRAIDTALLDKIELHRPSILDLKNLRKLTITISEGHQHISHVSALLCFCKLRHLTAITLDPVTQSCKEVLQSTLCSGTYMDLKC